MVYSIFGTLLLLLLPVQQASGADFTIKVLEKGSGVPIEGASVVLDESEIYETSNENGDVTFTGADWPKKVKVLAAGYEVLIQELPAERDFTEVYLVPIIVEGEGLEVVAERIIEKASKLSLEKEELLLAPGSGGDPLKTIFSLPGVVMAQDGTGGVYMRGSGAADNIIWVDRVPIGYLYHWSGEQSTIHPAIIEDMNIFLGGYPVEYGDSLGGVIDVRLRTPENDRMHYNLDISTLASSILLEGPVGSADGNGSFFLAGRRSYIDLLFSPTEFNDLFEDTDDENPDQITKVPEFYDYQGIYNHKLTEGNLEFYIFGAGDTMAMELNDSAKSDPHLQGELSSTISYLTIGLNWKQKWSANLDQTIALAYAGIEEDVELGRDDSGAPFFIKDEINHYMLQPEWCWKLNNDHRIFTGLSLNYYDIPVDIYISRAPTEDDIDFDFTSLEKRHFNETLYGTGVAPYVKQRLQWTDRMATILGLRYSDVRVSGGFRSQDFSPRGTVEYALTQDTLLTATLGRYVQMPEGGVILENFGNPGMDITKAEHRILGIEHQLTPLYSIKTEVYHKEMTDLVIPLDQNDPPDNFANEGEGEAWGLDVFFKRKQQDRKMGWMSFSYSKSERTNNITGITRDFSGDRPFSLTLVWGQPFPGIGYKWLWSFRFTTHSGTPYTSVTGRHREDPADPTSRWIPEYGEHNGERTSTYYKLDLRFDREFMFNEWKMKFYIDLQNATFQENIIGYDYGPEYEDVNNPTPITDMLFFPFFGVESKF